MGLKIHYSRPTTPAGPGFDINLGDVHQMGFAQNGIFQTPDAMTGLIDMALIGQSGVSSVILDDPNGTLGYGSDGIVGLRRMYFEETDAASCNPVWNGYVGAREYMRGENAGITPIGAARRVLVELEDDNAILRFRVATGSDANRPAETAGQRLSWLLGSDYLNTVHDNGNGWVSYACNPMDKNDYRGTFAGDILADVAKITGQNFWAQYDPNYGNIGLWFNDSNTSTTYVCPIGISNVAAEVDSVTTFAPHEDVKLRVDPSRVAAGVYLPYSESSNGGSGAIYVYDYPTAWAYGFRDHVAPAVTVKTRAVASNLAARYQQDNKTEDFLATATITVPSSLLTSIKPGQRILGHFQHFLSPYDLATWWRITRRTVARTSPSNKFYDVTLELSPQKLDVGFAQAVLGTVFNNRGGPNGVSISADGTYTLVWGDGGGGEAPFFNYGVIQDSANFAGQGIGKNISASGLLTLTVPAGYAGTYSMGMEEVSYDNAWWPVTPPPGTSNPQDGVAYIYNGNYADSGDGVANGCVQVNWGVAVNGVSVVDHQWGPFCAGLRGESPYMNGVHATGVHLNDGDVVTGYVTFTGDNWPLWSFGNTIGGGAAQNFGVIFLTRTGA